DLPQLLAGRRRESAEPEIIGAADERQSAGGQNDTAGTRAAGVLHTGRQHVRDPERLAIRDRARVHVDRHQFTPRRPTAEQLAVGIAEAAGVGPRARPGGAGARTPGAAPAGEDGTGG